ncbi:hypothetical protein HYS28_00185 [Candidatus Uhrbacteria bacterium]|nr:hypothetical protein [Candidatus Uhrbacteria bacterium]
MHAAPSSPTTPRRIAGISTTPAQDALLTRITEASERNPRLAGSFDRLSRFASGTACRDHECCRHFADRLIAKIENQRMVEKDVGTEIATHVSQRHPTREPSRRRIGPELDAKNALERERLRNGNRAKLQLA